MTTEKVPRDCRCPDCYLWLHDRCLFYEVTDNRTTDTLVIGRIGLNCSEKSASRVQVFDRDGVADD
jgi:hypothetical protein